MLTICLMSSRLFTRGITSGEPYDFDARIRRFDGVYRWFQVRGLPLRDMGGQDRPLVRPAHPTSTTASGPRQSSAR